jgi:haloalkane dehalogenase
VQRPGWVDGELYPFEDRWIEIDGSDVHYIDEGSGPPLLLLHGNPTWSFTWREVIKRVSGRYRCIALDYPGFGLSGPATLTPPDHARVVAAFVEQLGLNDVTLMFHDWGGPIGMWAAQQAPERYHGFVIGNSWAWPMNRNPGAQAFSRFLGGPVGRYLIKQHNLFVDRIIPNATKRVGPDERVMEQYRGPFPTPQSREAVAVLPKAIIGETDWLREVERGLSRIDDKPALIVWPTRDQAFREGERKRWESLFDDHRTVTLEGAGHYLGEDAPEEVAEALLSWSG